MALSKGYKMVFYFKLQGTQRFVCKQKFARTFYIKATFYSMVNKTDYAKICSFMHIIYNCKSLQNHRLGKQTKSMEDEVKKGKKMQNYLESRISTIKINHRKIRQINTPKC